jgi:hypothetical protein
MTISYNIIIIQFPIKNPIIIQNIIDRLNINTSFLPVCRMIVKNYIEYQLFITLIRNFQINKLREIAANRKTRSKRIIKCTVINSEKWEIIEKGERDL